MLKKLSGVFSLFLALTLTINAVAQDENCLVRFQNARDEGICDSTPEGYACWVMDGVSVTPSLSATLDADGNIEGFYGIGDITPIRSIASVTLDGGALLLGEADDEYAVLFNTYASNLDGDFTVLGLSEVQEGDCQGSSLFVRGDKIRRVNNVVFQGTSENDITRFDVEGICNFVVPIVGEIRSDSRVVIGRRGEAVRFTNGNDVLLEEYVYDNEGNLTQLTITDPNTGLGTIISYMNGTPNTITYNQDIGQEEPRFRLADIGFEGEFTRYPTGELECIPEENEARRSFSIGIFGKDE